MSAPFKIQLAYQQGDYVHVVDSKNVGRGSIPLRGGQFLSFTESTVTTKLHNNIYTYDCWGCLRNTQPLR